MKSDHVFVACAIVALCLLVLMAPAFLEVR